MNPPAGRLENEAPGTPVRRRLTDPPAHGSGGSADRRLLLESAREHRLEAADRYGELILAVMAALDAEPDLTGSVATPRLGGMRAYPTRLARRRVARRIVRASDES